eukprot:15353291-Ditylum_brightwellii.AAC.2
MERAHMLSLEAVRESVEQPINEETVEGDHAEVKKVSSLQHLTITDVKQLPSRRQTLYKIRFVVDKIARLGMAAGVNTKPKTPGQ